MLEVIDLDDESPTPGPEIVDSSSRRASSVEELVVPSDLLVTTAGIAVSPEPIQTTSTEPLAAAAELVHRDPSDSDDENQMVIDETRSSTTSASSKRSVA